MAYRPHRSHARYAPVIAPASPARRRPLRIARIAAPPAARPARSGTRTGLIHALPLALLLWAVIFAAARAIF